MKKTTKQGTKKAVMYDISSGDKSIIVPKGIRTFEKKVFFGTPTSDSVRIIVLKDYNGMNGPCYAGDIIDMPERRYKSLVFRGVVKLYDGKKEPNNLR